MLRQIFKTFNAQWLNYFKYRLYYNNYKFEETVFEVVNLIVNLLGICFEFCYEIEIQEKEFVEKNFEKKNSYLSAEELSLIRDWLRTVC